ncbi:MAG TPA: MlaD family protein [Solirubrobacteraceae bacterium]|nr:MlaD family protein [Solirubrobacteraceae bacterium]
MRRAIRRYGTYTAIIALFMAMSVVIGFYILLQERLQNPFASTYTINAVFSASTGLTPGLGQPANVAGVRVGEITNSVLENGRALVTMSIEPSRLRHVYADATATLFPNTPLDDMEINIDPGAPPARPLPSGATIPIANTDVPISSDQLLDGLDGDTREYAATLISSLGVGLKDQGPNLHALLEDLGPTTTQIHRLTAALAARRTDLAEVVHNLSVLSQAVASRDRPLGQLVDAGDATVTAIAGQDTALRQSVALLPSTLTAAEHSLGTATSFAQQLGPALSDNQAAAEALPRALHGAGSLLKVATPVIAHDLRPLVTQAEPVVSSLLPTTRTLTSVTPYLTSAFHVLQYTSDELAYNAGGRRQSYLFWLAWFVHNIDSALSAADGNGRLLAGTLMVNCSGLLAADPSIYSLLKILTAGNPLCKNP